MDKTKSERAQLQENIDSMELELRQVQEEIAEVTRQNENVSGRCQPKLLISTPVVNAIKLQTSQKLCSHFLSHFFDLAELQQDYLAKRELEQLIDETETSFTKINESIKTLICVVQKQEKHLLVKTGSK